MAKVVEKNYSQSKEQQAKAWLASNSEDNKLDRVRWGKTMEAIQLQKVKSMGVTD